MFERGCIEEVKKDRLKWKKDVVHPSLETLPEAPDTFTTISGLEVKRLYTPEDISHLDYSRDLGFPGQYPFTRGMYPTMYRGRAWTMRMFSGMGTAEDTNRRFKYLLGHGESGLSVAFDFPTLMGYCSDSPEAHGEVGKCGVAIANVNDMEILFEGIPLDKVTTSMTINPPTAVLLAMYILTAEKEGVSK